MYNKRLSGWLKHLDFILIDLICFQLAYIVAFVLRNQNFTLYHSEAYTTLNIVALIIDFLLIIIFNSYKNILRRNIGVDIQKGLQQTFMLLVLMMAYMFFVQEGETYSRLIIIILGPIYFVFRLGLTYVWKQVMLKRGKDKDKESVIVLTTPEDAEHIIEKLSKDNNMYLKKLTGIALTEMSGDLSKILENVPIVCTKENLLDYCCKNWVDEVMISVPQIDDEYLDLINDLVAAGLTVHRVLAEMERLDDGKQFVERMAGYVVITSTVKTMNMAQQFVKRFMDICGALVGCTLTILVAIILGPIIKIKSPGPLFFKQTRIGKNGKEFKIIKFRSMYMDAEERKKELMAQNRIADGMMFKMEFDPRVIGNYVDKNGKQHTGIGEFIRQHSIDELPQFFNVLVGQMSMVGTRPPTVDEYEKYLPKHRARLATKPGITGMWQVSGRSNITDFEEVVRMDMDYINNWSVWMDIRLILKTIKVVVFKDGAM